MTCRIEAIVVPKSRSRPVKRSLEGDWGDVQLQLCIQAQTVKQSIVLHLRQYQLFKTADFDTTILDAIDNVIYGRVSSGHPVDH